MRLHMHMHMHMHMRMRIHMHMHMRMHVHVHNARSRAVLHEVTASMVVRQVHDLLLQCADWTHKREVFLQLEAGTYQSARPPVDLETLLRRIGGDELDVSSKVVTWGRTLDVDCCRSCRSPM